MPPWSGDTAAWWERVRYGASKPKWVSLAGICEESEAYFGGGWRKLLARTKDLAVEKSCCRVVAAITV